MKYTAYFSEYIKRSGPPRVGQRQFRRMMNIVSLEVQLSTMQYVKKDLGDTPFVRRYDLVIQNLSDRISDLTRNLEPAHLMREFNNLSRSEGVETFDTNEAWDEDFSL
ncbi:MAG: hypothetical protein A3D31_07165 [Candidatus Fluviicola riflensis]|nr:MAG: hypothetical protein CHH17_07845 [Candidatus Fluviicola riflensis]OGS79730.1 MAG: hypothetical protein A3D31_07165 [Candidatus Fluviicola riflensis]OGS87163.1 MAG: hypothetical protein A2724_06625 [Fluviicola sp. RIFCSPHIGHO2_01_FULL_43_53]OGS89951.1 MAG: hypothetical protein A3E30_03370 [Fluviicola sp. RIFCSPHIGHO2_12_FULL_43_24]